MSTQVCCPCTRTGRCEKCCCKKKGCTNCRNPACTFKLPQVERRTEASVQGVFICDRASCKNYNLSEDYEWWMLMCTLGSIVAWFGLTHNLDITPKSGLYVPSLVLTTLIGVMVSFFKVCCHCKRTGRGEMSQSTTSTTRTRQQDNINTDLPDTKEDAVARGVELLKELEFRCHKAAHLNYKLSNDFDFWVFWLKTAITFASAIPSLALWDRIADFFNMDSDSWLYYLSLVLPALVGCTLAFFKVCPDFLLPTLEKKCMLHNQAGAGWQDLEIQIRGFRATTTKDDVTTEKIFDFIKTISKQRREVCYIVKPSDKMRKEGETLIETFRQTRKRNKENANLFFMDVFD